MVKEKIKKKNEGLRKPVGEINPKSTFVLGVDPSRQGADETGIVILEQLPHDDNIFVVHIEAIDTPDLRQVIGRVIYLDKFFNFKRVIVDTTGLGAGVTDILKDRLKGKVEGVWYTQKIKAEMFQNLKILMSRPNAKLYIPDYKTSDNPDVKKMYFQFLSITEEYNDRTGIKIPKISHEVNTHDDIINSLCLAATYFNVTGKQNKRQYVISGFNKTA